MPRTSHRDPIGDTPENMSSTTAFGHKATSATALIALQRTAVMRGRERLSFQQGSTRNAGFRVSQDRHPVVA